MGKRKKRRRTNVIGTRPVVQHAAVKIQTWLGGRYVASVNFTVYGVEPKVLAQAVEHLCRDLATRNGSAPC